MTMGLIGAAAGVAIPAVANALGIGKNDTRAKTFDESSAYNPHAFQYGGHAGTADATAMRFSAQAQDAQNRQAAQAGLAYVNPSVSNAWMTNNAQDRTQQNQVARMMMARAQGLVPSIASQQAALDMQRAGAAQSSAAASARGAAGLALAGQNAANNTATMQSAISNNAQINAANERMSAEQNALGAYTGIRTGDAQMQAQSAQQAQYNAQLAAQQNQFNAGLQQQQHGLNDAYSMGLYGQENNVRQLQLQGSMYGQGLLGQSQMNATNQNVAISGANANREYQYYQQGMGALQGGLAGTQTGGGPPPPPPIPAQQASPVGNPPPLEQFRANGGPVAAGRPYVVGERGPELIVPTGNGMVYPAEHPASRMAVGSDDRMKMGMSPLGLLGFGGGGMNPTSGPVGGGAMGAAPSSYEVLSGGGENVAASGDAMSRVATQYQNDPTGGMQSGGLLSDDRAKENAFNLGMAKAYSNIRDGLTQRVDPSPTMASLSAFANIGNPAANAHLLARQMTNDYVDGADSGGSPSAGVIEAARYLRNKFGGTPANEELPPDPAYENEAREAEAFGGADSIRRYPGAPADPVTKQLATGLAPIRFQYKPGMGPAGEQTGVRAQAAASQPITASMIRQRPDGLLQIDPNMGLSTALAASGHLAQKQQEQEAKLNGLLALAARREGY